MKQKFVILLIFTFAVLSIIGCEKLTSSIVDSVEETDIPTKDMPETYAIALVQQAIDKYQTEGAEATAAFYHDPANVDGQWYVFITDKDDIFVAHPLAQHFLGKDIKETDSIDGTPLGKNIAMATEDGLWTDYLWPNPETNKLEIKRTWSRRYDGYIFSTGYYVPWTPDPSTVVKATKDNPEAFTREIVLKAIARYEAIGIEATATYYNDKANIDGQWYVFITGENDSFVAHAPRPDFIGTDLKDVIGEDGTPVGENIAKATSTGLWVEYMWPNPENMMEELKRTWAIRHDGYLFGSGYYEPSIDDSDQEMN
ncbi:hypothetical protein C6497_07660 [Candidatus Poribacteria bacterium]|nr:MAG: hypothetical protein C6497_07660 [Candidatus Poribacteria bacterium]